MIGLLLVYHHPRDLSDSGVCDFDKVLLGDTGDVYLVVSRDEGKTGGHCAVHPCLLCAPLLVCVLARASVRVHVCAYSQMRTDM